MECPTSAAEGIGLADVSFEVLHRLARYLTIGDVLRLSETCWKLRRAILPTLLNRLHYEVRRSNHFQIMDEERMPSGGRFGHACCYHSPLNRVYIYGGASKNTAVLNDLRYFDLKTRKWGIDVYHVRDPKNGPGAMAFCSLVSFENSLILFGALVWETSTLTRIHTLDLETNEWVTDFHDSPCLNTAGHSAIMWNDLMVVFGGSLFGDVATNQFFAYDCKSRILKTINVHPANLPEPRCLSALAVVDDATLLLVGGRSRLNQPFQVFQDAYLIHFVDQAKTTAHFVQIRTDSSLWPRNMWTNTTIGTERLVVICQPARCTHVAVRQESLSSLLNSSIVREHFMQFTTQRSRLPPYAGMVRCTNADLPDHHHQHQPHAYPRFPAASAHQTCIRSFEEHEQRVHAATPERVRRAIRRAWRDAVDGLEARRQMRLLCNDFARTMMSVAAPDPPAQCHRGLPGRGACYATDGCIYKGLRFHYANESNEFVLQLVGTLYQMHVMARGGLQPIPMVHPPIDMLNCWTPAEEQEQEVLAINEVLILQPLVPIHRVVLDAPLTTTFFTLDLQKTKAEQRVCWHQQPIPLLGHLYHKYAPLVCARAELVSCGGFDSAMQELSPARAHTPPPNLISDTTFSIR